MRQGFDCPPAAFSKYKAMVTHEPLRGPYVLIVYGILYGILFRAPRVDRDRFNKIDSYIVAHEEGLLSHLGVLVR